MLTIRDIYYLFNLAKTLNYICNFYVKIDKKFAVLYHLTVAGEITATQHGQKLTDSARKLLPRNVCSALQTIRDDYATHGGNLAAVSDTEIIKGITYDIPAFQGLEGIVCEIAIRECIELFVAKLQILIAVEKEKINQTKILLGELDTLLTHLTRIDINLLPTEVRELWIKLWPEIINPCATLLNDLKGAFKSQKEKSARLESIFKVKKSNSVSKLVDELLVAQKTALLTFPRPKFITEIPDFCNSTLSYFKFIKKENIPLYVSDKLMEEEKNNATTLLYEYSDKLKFLIDKLNSCEEKAIKDYRFGMDTEAGSIICDIRWHLLVVYALFEASGVVPDNHFKTARNKAIHDFADLDCLKERLTLNQIIEQKGIPYGKIAKKENTESLKRKSKEDKEKESTSEIEKKARYDDQSLSMASNFKPS